MQSAKYEQVVCTMQVRPHTMAPKQTLVHTWQLDSLAILTVGGSPIGTPAAGTDPPCSDADASAGVTNTLCSALPPPGGRSYMRRAGDSGLVYCTHGYVGTLHALIPQQPHLSTFATSSIPAGG